jgi:phage terminase small subunit
MALTAKQEAFAQAIASGMTQADAYRSAYSASKMGDGALHVEASKLMDNPKIALRLSELQSKLEKKALWTREMSVLALADIAHGVEARANEKVAAIKELNAMHGFNEPTKVKVDGEIQLQHKSVLEITARINQIIGDAQDD